MLMGCSDGGFLELSMEEHFRICHKFGFRHMEFGIGNDGLGHIPEDAGEEQITEFLALGREYGIKTSCCCLFNDFTLPDPLGHQKQLGRCIGLIRLAKQANATLVRLFAGFTVAAELTEPIWQRMLEAFRECQRIADELGLTITVETMPKFTICPDWLVLEHSVTTDRDCLKRLVAELPAGMGFCYDPGNIKTVQPEDHKYALDILNTRINYCHLKDWSPRDGGWLPVAAGEDDLDYAALLPKIKYEGVYVIEYEQTQDVVEGIQRSLDYLGNIVELEF